MTTKTMKSRSHFLDQLPKAYVTLDRGYPNLWKIKKCPLCGKSHVHGAGGPDYNPRKLLGHRWPHCKKHIPGNKGYVLVEEETPQSINEKKKRQS